MRNPFTTVAVVVLGAGLFFSCDKWVQAPPPTDVVTEETPFQDEQAAEDAMQAVYTAVMDAVRGPLCTGITTYVGLSGREFVRTTEGQESVFDDHKLTGGNPLCSGLYSNSYSYIRACNVVLHRLMAAEALADSVRGRIEGEAHFLRAFTYFYLVNLYGDVPLVTGIDARVNNDLPRRQAASVYGFLLGELMQARQLLRDDATDSGAVTGRTRPSRAAAEALLARVFLYRRNWAAAADYATAVIQRSGYQLEAPGDVFLANSRETIWQLRPAGGVPYAPQAMVFIPRSGQRIPTYALTDAILSSFEPGDQRQVQWTALLPDAPDYVYPYKHKATESSATHPECQVVLRLAEQYLIRAEARYRLGDTEGAKDDLAVIRQRAGLPGTAVMKDTSLFGAIQRERRGELFAEWGHRWLDLKRWALIDPVMTAEADGWRPEAAWYPLPAIDVLRNPNLWQNAGY